MYVEVVLDLPYPPGAKTFTYTVPKNLEADVCVGKRVVVPYGRGNKIEPAFVVQCTQDIKTPVDVQLKAIEDVADEEPVLSKEQVTLGLWTAKRFLSPIYLVFAAMLPAHLKQKLEQVLVRLTDTASDLDGGEQELWTFLKTPKTVHQLDKAFSDWRHSAEILASQQYIQWRWRTRPLKEKRIAVYSSTILEDEAFASLEKELARAPRQYAVLLALFVDGPQTAGDLRERFNGIDPRSALDALIAKGYVCKEESFHRAALMTADAFHEKKDVALSNEQEAAMLAIGQALNAARFASFLLQGITGSGKTELYLRSVEKVLAKGKTALVLVPEISLTDQMLGRFAAKFPEDIALLHSRLTDKDRYQQWQDIQAGCRRIVIGTRSAVFAPLKEIGIIIVDEGHDGAYKQSEPDPRYHAHTVAEKRAQINQAVFISGSATPSVDLTYRAEAGTIRRLSMHERPGGAVLPNIIAADMRDTRQTSSMLGGKLTSALAEAFSRGDQALLYMNRRGYSTALICDECGEAVRCPHCDVALTYHQGKNILRCHYCDFIVRPPQTCPSCGAQALNYKGVGTEQVQHIFKDLFPDALSVRLDSDTAQQQGDILRQMKQGKAQVLIGTQMIAKGLDFPNITLTGIINADLGLYLPDYRAGERTFQELTQVAGRTGRGHKPGTVILQTKLPDHPVIQAVLAQDYDMFYKHEIQVRKMIGYPPFFHLMQVVISAGDRDRALEGITELTENLRALMLEDPVNGAYYVPFANDESALGNPARQVTLLGPSAAPLERIRNRWRFQLILKAPYLPTLLTVGNWCKNYRFSSRKSKSLRLTVDVDPENIL